MKSILPSVTVVLIAFCWSVEARAAHSDAERQILDQLNQERQKAGLAVLEWNDGVAEAARAHSRLLAENGQLSHQYLGEPGLAERIAATGPRFTLAAENVARTEYVEDVHLALMNSPGHRANMLDPKYNAVGIGVVEQNGKVYVTQDFVFLVPVYSEAQFSGVLAGTFNLARRKTPGLEARTDSYLHDLACSTDGDAAKLSGSVSGRYVIVFTSSEPHHLPEALVSRINAGYRHVNFGVCFRPDQQHGYANFWVIAVFAN